MKHVHRNLTKRNMTLKIQTDSSNYLRVTGQKILKIDETILPVKIRNFR